MGKNVTSYKGFNSPLKVQVTRIDDPLQLNRVQVYIPTYHGKFEQDLVGYGDDLGSYPWATMCSILFKDSSNFTSDSMSELYSGELPMIFPTVGTIGWVLFEGGDVRAPIYMGSLGKGEMNEIVEGSYTGSDNNNMSITGTSSELSVMADIIFEQEGGGKNYGNINPLDVDAISIGVLQWHADNGRELITRIKNANPGVFNHLYNFYNATFPIEKSWKGFYVSKGDNNYNCIKELLTGNEGKQCQDEYVNEFLSSYVDQGKSVGVNDYKAQIFFCDMYNQSPAGAMKIARSTSNKSLDGLYQETMNGGHWLGSSAYHNNDRRTRVYNKVKQMDTQAALSSVTSPTMSSAMSVGLTFAYPTDCKNVSVQYVKLVHPYITIAEDGIEGQEVRASHDGTAKPHNSTGRYGKWVSIISGKYETRYLHLRNFSSLLPNLETGVSVKAGDVIGYVGHTGDVSSTCLDFQLLVNGNAKDPLPYLNGVSQSINATTSGLVETAVTWMINIANDNTHGYSQAARTGPDYDCTSLPTHGYRAAGLDINPGTYTGNMKANFEAVGFTAIPYSRGMNLLRGDVIFWHKSGNKGHAVTYLGDGQIVSAHSNKDGKQGDSSGNEIDVSGFYETDWQWVMRYEK